MLRPRSLLLLPLLLSLALMLGGCWDQRQIADLAVVLGAGVDIIPEEQALYGETVLLTVELDSRDGKDKGSPALFSASGQTVMSALANLAQSLNRQLHWNHLQFLLIGEEAARAGVDQFLGFFYDYKDMSPHVYFAISEGLAQQALSQQAGLSPYVSLGLHDTLLKHKYDANGYVNPVSLQSYMTARSVPRLGALAPLVAVLSPTEAGAGGGADGAGGEAQLYFAGQAVLDEHGKYVGRLRRGENTGAALMMNQARDFPLVLWEPNMKQQVSVELTAWRAKPSWSFEGEDISLTLYCRAEGILGDKQKSVRYDDKASIAHLEQLFAEELERQIKQAWRRARMLEVDFLGLGEQIYRRHEAKWNELLPEWPQALRRAQLTVEIESKVQVTGQSR